MRGKFLIVCLMGIFFMFSCDKENDVVIETLMKIEGSKPTAMTSDLNGNIWLAQGSMLGQYTPTLSSNHKYLSIGEISSISVVDSNRIAAGGESGYAIFKNNEWDVVFNDYNSGDDAPSVYCGKDRIYIDRENDFIIIENDKTTYLDKDNIQFPDCEVNEIQENSKNEIVLATNGYGIIVFNNNRWLVYDTLKNVEDVVVADNDIIYFVHPSTRGINMLNNGIYSNLVPPETVLGATNMWSINIDMDGNIWSGSTSSSFDGALFIYIISDDFWSSIQADNNYAHDSFQISKLSIDKFNNVWFSSGYGSLCIYNSDGVKY